MIRLPILLLLLSVALTAPLAQRSELRKTADDHFAKRDWAAALATYSTYLSDTARAGDVLARFNLGVAALKTGDLDLARRALEQAATGGMPAARVNYQLSKVSLAAGDRTAALDQLRTLAENGFPAYLPLVSDKDLADLRGSPTFDSIVSTVRQTAYPCADDPRYRKLDFWLGDWEVYAFGQFRAHSRITKGEGSCTLHENYLTTGGYTGRSFNYYDPTDSLYHQIWVDRSGAISRYREVEARPGFLLMETVGPGPLIRMSYTARGADTVVQSLEMSQDTGSTWNNVFRGEYRRIKGTSRDAPNFLSAREIVERSQAEHDPLGRWKVFRDTVRFQEPRLGNPGRSTFTVLDNARGAFVFERAYGDDLIRFEVDRRGCRFALNGATELSPEIIEKNRLNCSRAKNYHTYYRFLHGLPMSLNDYQWEVTSAPVLQLFKGEKYWTFSAHVKDAAFSPDWTLYFDPENYALRAISYRPEDESRGAGEYLLLSGELVKGGVRLVRMFNWYDKETDEYLGSDIGF